MIPSLRHIFGRKPETTKVRPPRLHLPDWPAAVYAIGDVHGCLPQLENLQRRIIADASSFGGEKLIVCVGDYVDRGPDSAGVLSFLNSPLPQGFSRICLAGNHERMMIQHIDEPNSLGQWWSSGGSETLASYGIEPSQYMSASSRDRTKMLASHIPSQHVDFLRNLPVMVTLPRLVLVHAGLRTDVPLEEQDDNDLLWLRSQPATRQIQPEEAPLLVHGHTPTATPIINANSINIDTGAFATGILTAVCLRHGEQPRFLNTITALDR